MTSRIPMLVSAVVFAALLTAPLRAQYGVPQAGGLQLPFENNRVRITQLSVAPGAALPAAANQVLVYLTADADGRMPAEAVWQAGGGTAAQNRGPLRLEAIAIEFKDVSPAPRDGTPPEALDTQYGVDVSTLIDNPRVLVTRQRYGPIAYGGPLHLHPEDVIVVYLRGGYTWPGADLWGASRVHRGDVDVIPANTLHRFGNAGSDPLEILTIVPR